MKHYDMTLPDAVLAFKLLDTACLDENSRQLALTACADLTFASMKSALKRIFGGKSTEASKSSDTQDGVFFTNQRAAGRFKGSSISSQTRQRQPQQGTNPVDKHGRRTRCAICQSTYHWAKDCPHRRNDVKLTEDEDVEECNITLFTEAAMTESEIFLTESQGSAIIDTACTRTVCGEKWLESYIKDLNRSQIHKMMQTESQSCRPFRFGDGQVVYSNRKVKLPAKIGQTKCHIESEVVPADIPLLLSKMSLKRAGTVLDMENDRVVMFKEQIPLELTSSGHYCVDIRDETAEVTYSEAESEVLVVTAEMSPKEKQKILLKLHKQFGHASADRLQRLIQSSGNNDKDCLSILQQIIHECEICQKHQRSKPKPAVGLPMASEYNETVAMDLHELEPGVWYLHIIDHFTRFSAGNIVRSKKPSEIINSFIHSWISVHGAPKRIYTDNGGEFNNEEVRNMAESFNIETKTTAGYSPWSNGLLERHNMTLTEILLKVRKENGCSWQTALDWALMAKNSMINVHGYSPHQLVFGQNPNLPSVLVDKPPALQDVSTNTRVGQHLAVLHASRKAFTEVECSERIRRALRKQIRPTDEKYETGDRVYYKRTDSIEWKGPAVVIGQDGAVVFIRHGGILVRAHQSRLRKVNAQDENQPEQLSVPVNGKENESTEKDVTENSEDESDVHENIETDETENFMENNDNTGSEKDATTAASPTEVKLKTGQIITFTNRGDGVQHTARVLGRAGKAKGQYKNWYNVQHLEPDGSEGHTQALDMSQFDNLHTEHENTDSDVLITKDVSFDAAKKQEFENWRNNGVYEEVPDDGQKCISTRWVCTLKETTNGIVPKARLVARGFEESNIHELQKVLHHCLF
ncbi:uncharacterized protein LOC112144625 [Oryzias melastigma]|uniref:uncharacterized protein LOC112144625 n=1 Tax=Oryzias melastigma TaxID=30732 RepID=UPI00168D9021|nr:uncharacterized protein LOC112144625 [Oryzias melastigma]